MKKYIFKIALITITTLFSFEKIKAQENQFILTSNENKNDHTFDSFHIYSSFDIFGFDNNSFYTYYNTIDETLLFESFSINDLRSTVRTKIELPKIDGKKVKFEQIIYIKNHIYLFTSLYDKKNKIYTFYAYIIKDNGQLNTEGTKIDEISCNDIGDRNYVNISLSNDSNNILILKTFDKIISSDEIKGQISYKVLDENLKIVYSNQIELNRQQRVYKISKLLLDKNNNLFFLISERKYIKELKDMRFNYTINLYSSKDSKLYTTEVNLDEIHMLQADLLINEKDQLICAGTYAIEKKFGEDWMNIKCLKGVYYVVLDKNNLSIISKNKKNIEETLNDSKLYRYNLLNVFTLKNNQLILICEFQNTLLTSFIGSSEKTYETTYGSLIITSFDLNNKNESWVSYVDRFSDKKICKVGNTRHRIFTHDDSFKLLYNCNRQISFDEKGSVTDKFIFEDSQNFNVLFSGSCFQTNNNTIISGTYSDQKGYGYSKIVFK
jgi:hypothetical protein